LGEARYDAFSVTSGFTKTFAVSILAAFFSALFSLTEVFLAGVDDPYKSAIETASSFEATGVFLVATGLAAELVFLFPNKAKCLN
jgi:hypothetical protein